MNVKLIIVVASVCLCVGSGVPELNRHARGVAGNPSSAFAAETSPNVPTLTLSVSPCYFYIQAGKALYGWPNSDYWRGNREVEKVEIKVGFGVAVSMSGTRQIKLLSPDVEGVTRTEEGKLAATAGAPFIALRGSNPPEAPTKSYTQVIDSYIMPLPVAAETVIGPRVYEVDGVRLEPRESP